PTGQPRGVVTRAVVGEPGLLVAFLAGVPVAARGFGCAAGGVVGGAAVRVVLLVGDDLRGAVQFQRGGAEVVAVLVADELARRRILADGTGLDDRPPGGAVVDVQRLAFQGHRPADAGPAAEQLDTAEVQPLLDQSRLFLPGLADPLAGRVVA